MTRLSSRAPVENQGLVARHVTSAPSFSATTFSVKMLVVRLPSWPPPVVVVVTSPLLLIGSPSSSHTIFAGGYEPHASHRKGTGWPAVSRSFGVTIFTFNGFTFREQRWKWELLLFAIGYGPIAICWVSIVSLSPGPLALLSSHGLRKGWEII